jgi:uncharacterized protein
MNHLESAINKGDKWWQYLVMVLVAVLASNLIGALPFMGAIAYQVFSQPDKYQFDPNNLTNFSAYGIDNNIGLLLLILPFAVGLFFVFLFYKPLHKRHYKLLINGTKNIRWNKYFTAFSIWFLLSGLGLLAAYCIDPSLFTLNFNVGKFLLLIVISMLFLPLQTTFEEVMFRGYFAQGVGLLTKNRYMAIIIPGILFGLMHIANPEVKEFGFWATMPTYIFYGLVFGLITTLDDGIESAMGAHAANNIFASIFLTHKSSVLQTDALFVANYVNLKIDTITLFASGILFVYLLHKKYRWNWAILSQKIEAPIAP